MKNKRKGIAMLVVISLVLMLLILGGAVLMISTGHFSTSYRQIRRARAYYAAEAAIQRVLWQLRTDQITPPQNNVPFPEDINNISASKIDIDILDKDQAGHPPGVYPIEVTVTY